MKYSLSKSRYCSGLQCPKTLWLKENIPDAYDSSCMNQVILDTGSRVGDLAMSLFGDYVEVPYGNLTDMISATEQLIRSQTPIITEASISVDGLFCSVDILKMISNTEVELYEVKSSTGVKDVYYHDAAFQYYILTKLGYTVVSCNIVHINNKYIRHGALDINKLFTVVDITEDARHLQQDISNNIDYIRKYMTQETEPSEDIGPHCFSPYSCGFFDYCSRNLPKPNVFNVAGMQKKAVFRHYNNGIISFKDLYSSGSLSANQKMQVEHELYPGVEYIDVQAIKAFLDTLSFPLYFLDFESFQPAIPPYDDVCPFQQIVFQYSLHYIENEGGQLKHKEFLAYPGDDPRRALAEQLCTDIPKDVCVVAYNMSFEKGRIKNLATLYPDLREHLMNIHDNIVDLMIPFQKKWYYCRAMQGSYSIKYVLPALFPDDPELDYHNLEGVHNGSEASSAFEKMVLMDSEELEITRQQLLKYCGLDTYAMVKVWEKLKEIVK